jgi:hypothetical protein
VFWLYGGILTALTPAPAAGRAHWLPWALAAGVLVSAAPRAVALRNAADLEHRGVGLSSPWQHDDAQRYREAGTSFALFLPASGRLVEVPMRRAPGAPDPLLVEIRIHGRLVDTIAVTGDGIDRRSSCLKGLPLRARRFRRARADPLRCRRFARVVALSLNGAPPEHEQPQRHRKNADHYAPALRQPARGRAADSHPNRRERPIEERHRPVRHAGETSRW